jgi:flagellar basal body-associated protein FliL
MNGLEVIILIGLVVAMAAGVGYFLTKGQPTLKEMTEDYHKNEEIKEIVELSQELYNKDLRPIVAKKAPKAKETKSEFPIEQPAKKKRKYYPKKKKQGDN